MLLAVELHPYCWGFLNAHPERAELPEARAQEIQKGHLGHMQQMAAAGHLLAAGPLVTPGGPRGIVVYRCESAAQAEEWTKPDPAVVNKRLSVEMYRWTSPGIWGRADPHAQFTMVRLPLGILMRTERTTIPPDDVRQAHLTYSAKLIEQGKLRSFGAFEGSPDKLVVLVYGAISLEEARGLAAGDPLVNSGWGTPVMHLWLVADESVPRP